MSCLILPTPIYETGEHSVTSEGSTSFASRRKLLKACMVSFLGAVFLAIAFVLPAELGIDLLGTGKVLGLLALDQPQPGLLENVVDSDLPLQNRAVEGGYKLDSRELVLGPYDYVEYKYYLAQGAGMVFVWKASASLNQDFHGEPEPSLQQPVQSYDNGVRAQASGSFVAPFSGLHGWFWENRGPTPVRVRVDSAGFYPYSVEIKSNRERVRHEVDSLAEQFPENGELL